MRVWMDIAAGSIRFFTSQAARDAADLSALVATATNPGAGNPFVATGTAGLTVNGTMSGGGGVDGNTGNIDFNPPQATLPFSFFLLTITITDEPSLFQARVREGGIGGAAWRLNSSGAPNINEGALRAGIPLSGKFFGDAN